MLIVGAGPAGLTLALLLAERGRTVAVYERWGATFPLPRAAAMSHESVRTFQSAGVLEQLMPYLNLDGEKVSTSLLTADGETLGTMNFTGEGSSGFPPMVSFHQPDVDGLLSELCEAHPLVELHRRWDARAIEQGDADAVVTLHPVEGDQPRDGDPVTARVKDGTVALLDDLVGAGRFVLFGNGGGRRQDGARPGEAAARTGDRAGGGRLIVMPACSTATCG